jgi:hypothetical protein
MRRPAEVLEWSPLLAGDLHHLVNAVAAAEQIIHGLDRATQSGPMWVAEPSPS